MASESTPAELEGDPEIRVLVLTGTGRGFIAGADITEDHGVSQAAFDGYRRLGRSVFSALEPLPPGDRGGGERLRARR